MNSLEKFRDINTFIFDIDGVITDGQLHINEDGIPLRRVYMRDEYALSLALKAGYRIFIISGGKAEGIKERLVTIGVTDLHLAVWNKFECLQEIVFTENIDLGQTLYMGDDIPDYEAMRHVHLPTCPADASREVISIAQYVSPFKGGEGCVRDVIEKTMLLQGKWNNEQ